MITPDISKIPAPFDHSGSKHIEPVEHLTEEAATNDILSMFNLAASGQLRFQGNSKSLTSSSIKAINGILFHGDLNHPSDLSRPEMMDILGQAGLRPYSWMKLLLAAGFFRRLGPECQLTKAGISIRNLPVRETIRKVWESWLIAPSNHEMTRIHWLEGIRSKKRPLHAASPVRNILNDCLRSCQPGQWIPFNTWCNLVDIRTQNVSFVRYSKGLKTIGRAKLNDQQWETVIRRLFSKVFLLETAAVLGLIDVTLKPLDQSEPEITGTPSQVTRLYLTRYDGLTAIRLTLLGVFCLGMKLMKSIHTPEPESITVLPNLEIVRLSYLTVTSDLFFLDRFCERQSDRVWRIDRMKILRLMSSGLTPDTILSYLTRRHNGILPETLITHLNDLKERSEGISFVDTAGIYECATPQLARLILSDPVLKKTCSFLGDKRIIIPERAKQRFRKQLAKLGIRFPES
ncbi:hypothetical protein JW979_14400 [bacterium]|nr:hypothetical protein [candidate division CSSED10-310 bacterium]